MIPCSNAENHRQKERDIFYTKISRGWSSKQQHPLSAGKMLFSPG